MKTRNVKNAFRFTRTTNRQSKHFTTQYVFAENIKNKTVEHPNLTFNGIPVARHQFTKHLGVENKEPDFQLEDGKILSLKTNIKKVLNFVIF